MRSLHIDHGSGHVTELIQKRQLHLVHTQLQGDAYTKGQPPYLPATKHQKSSTPMYTNSPLFQQDKTKKTADERCLGGLDEEFET
jgi:hypothetical protein